MCEGAAEGALETINALYAYATTRFVAAGGTGVTYYGWYGGTNFGREGMYFQTPRYWANAALDEWGPPTTKSMQLARLNRLLHEHTVLLMASAPVCPSILRGIVYCARCGAKMWHQWGNYRGRRRSYRCGVNSRRICQVSLRAR